jgi:hypothetical protein
MLILDKTKFRQQFIVRPFKNYDISNWGALDVKPFSLIFRFLGGQLDRTADQHNMLYKYSIHYFIELSI